MVATGDIQVSFRAMGDRELMDLILDGSNVIVEAVMVDTRLSPQAQCSDCNGQH